MIARRLLGVGLLVLALAVAPVAGLDGRGNGFDLVVLFALAGGVWLLFEESVRLDRRDPDRMPSPSSSSGRCASRAALRPRPACRVHESRL